MQWKKIKTFDKAREWIMHGNTQPGIALFQTGVHLPLCFPKYPASPSLIYTACLAPGGNQLQTLALSWPLGQKGNDYPQTGIKGDHIWLWHPLGQQGEETPLNGPGTFPLCTHVGTVLSSYHLSKHALPQDHTWTAEMNLRDHLCPPFSNSIAPSSSIFSAVLWESTRSEIKFMKIAPD